jgi:20S proteasome alpha/beta subunit
MMPKPLPPKPKRLPERKAGVTFIVGLRCTNGLVLASDSLEVDGYTKKHVQKIFKYEVAGKWGLAFGCAGTAAACTNFSDRLLEILGQSDTYDRRGTEKIIEATMGYMRNQYPSEVLDVVIGLWNKEPSEARLYKAHGNAQCLSVESDYACAGMDISLARFLLDCVFASSDANVFDGSHVAALVTSVMKDKADGVGGPTQLLHYHEGNDRWCVLKKKAIEQMEQCGFIDGRFTLADLEKSIRQFCWSRFPHEFRPAEHDD